MLQQSNKPQISHKWNAGAYDKGGGKRNKRQDHECSVLKGWLRKNKNSNMYKRGSVVQVS